MENKVIDVQECGMKGNTSQDRKFLSILKRKNSKKFP